jgi:hypothetical protein
MSLHTPNNFTMFPCKCHVCYGDIDEQQNAIEHTGHGCMLQTKNLEGYVAIWLHPECATILALRLAHDVMRIRNRPDQPRRVVDELKSIAKQNQVKGVNHGNS